MSKVYIVCSIATRNVGSRFTERFETEYTREAWEGLTADEREAVIDEYYNNFLETDLDSSSRVEFGDE